MSLPAVSAKPVPERRILLCVIGITPQVVTETLYALAILEGRPCPTEIHLIASEEGAHRAKLELLAPGRAQLASLCRQHGLPMPRCDDRTIHVIQRDGSAVTDLRSAGDNEAAADKILNVVRGLTEDKDSSIHFSIAGGRKTMTYYLGYCASLLGRPQDDMSHVMVNLPFEQSPDFFFPPKAPAVIHDRTGRPHSTSEARIDLASVPFLRLRNKLPEALLSKARSFSTVVRILNALDEGRLELKLATPQKAGGAAGYSVSPAPGLDIDLSPQQFALLWFFASIKHKLPGVEIDSGNWKDLHIRHCLPVYREITRGSLRTDNTADADETLFRNQIDKLNKALRDKIGPGADESYGVAVEGTKRRYTYALRMSKDFVTLNDSAQAKPA